MEIRIRSSKKENKEKLEKEIKSIEEKLFKKRKEFELNKDAILSTNFNTKESLIKEIESYIKQSLNQ